MLLGRSVSRWARRAASFRASSTAKFSSTRTWELLTEKEKEALLVNSTTENIRNFSIIAHVDHGKSTLSDRLMEETGNISNVIDKFDAQVLDTLEVERDRGITVKAQTASMFYRSDKYGPLLFNLIDTPGHVDFSYEVSRSLAACQGALILVDASQGIQAQTLANYRHATDAGLDIVPIATKIDLPHADKDIVTAQMISALNVKAEDILFCSAKSGVGVEAILPAIAERIRPPPCMDPSDAAPFYGLLFDSWFDEHRGVILLVSVRQGRLRTGDILASYYQDGLYEIQEVGLMYPQQKETGLLRAGQVGYIICGIRSTREVRLGDTLYGVQAKTQATRGLRSGKRAIVSKANQLKKEITPLPGFQPAKCMVFAGVFPAQSSDFEGLQKAIEKLTLTDASVQVTQESSDTLGLGYRCGFLGMLHMDVFSQRLEQQFDTPVILTAPTVPYKAELRNGDVLEITSPSNFPALSDVQRFLEPMVEADLLCPEGSVGPVLEVCDSARGTLIAIDYLDTSTATLRFKLPLAEVVTGFYDRIKTVSAGFASLDYWPTDYEETELVLLSLMINRKPVDALSTICPRTQVTEVGKRYIKKLAKVVERQNFEVAIQAAVGTKVIASTKIKAYRKDVLTKAGKTVGGGDESRKKKLLEKQKAGKKRMKMVGDVKLGQEAFLSVLAKD